MAVALGHAHGDAGPLATKLRRACRPPHALWRVDRAYIVDVTQDPDDPEGAVFRWGILATVALAPGPVPLAWRPRS